MIEFENENIAIIEGMLFLAGDEGLSVKEIKNVLNINETLIRENLDSYKRKLNDVPDRLLLEEIGNSITHGVGFLIAIFMFILMLLKSNNTLKITSSIVIGFMLKVLTLVTSPAVITGNSI